VNVERRTLRGTKGTGDPETRLTHVGHRQKNRMRILITGASGSGTTTIGRALANELGFAFFDADDYYWTPSNPPFQHKRERGLRLSLLLADLDKAGSAVLSGSVVRWGIEIEES